jgi:hypothetical protein
VKHHSKLALALVVNARFERPLDKLSARSSRFLSVLGAVSLWLLPACRSGDVDERATAAAPVVVSAGGAAAAGAGGAPAQRPHLAAGKVEPPLASKPWHIPVGPNLSIVPNRGVGPIRFGAHLDTIERLMGEPCEDKRQEGPQVTCRYAAQAVDFVLDESGLKQIRAHRLGRPFNPDGKADYGIFNGHFESGVAFGMLDRGVREMIGAPRAVRSVQGDNPNHTVEEHDYDGFTLQFDRISPESVVLGGVIMNAPAGGIPAAEAAEPDPAAADSKAGKSKAGKSKAAPPKPVRQQPLH